MSKNTILSSVLAVTVSSWALVSTSAAETIHQTRHATNTLSDQNLCAVSSDILRKEIHTYTKPHFIQSGEVIWSIAQKYGISWDQLIEIRKATESIPTNQSVNWTKIQAGKTIQVPINNYAVKQIQLYTALQEKKNLDQELNALHEQGKMWTLQKKLNEVTPWLFPKEVVNLGINAMTQGLMGNMRDDFTPDNPIINDKLFQREVDCAGKIKAFFGFSLENTSDLKQLVASKDQDAWILLGSLIDLGFTRKVEDDFMVYFDKSKVGQREIIKKGEELNYYRAIQDLSIRIKSQGIPWSVIGAYFKGSNYKNNVKEEYQKRVKSGKNYHINTHQFKILGNNTLEFPASSVRDFRTSTRGIDMWESMSSIDFVINYIQDKAPYQNIRSKSRRDIIEKWLKIFHESLEVKINGVSIDLLEEIQKPEWERIQIQVDDTIEFFGPVAMDWFHVKTSDNKFKSDNNTTRTFFFIQALVNPDFVISEKIEPNEKMQGHKPSIGGIEYEIPVRNLLFAQEWDLLKTVYKEAILKYIMWKKELLDYTPKQLENLNAIEAQKDISLTGATVIALNSKRAKLRKNRITETIETLSTQKQTTFHRHYTQQIRALKLLGYMQNESELNPGAVKTHAPLPLIDTTKINIDAIYTNYLNKRKQELQAEYKNSCHIDRNFLEIRFLEWDTSIQIFDRIASELSYHAERFPSFGNLWDFTPLQKQEFLYELTKNSEIPGLNITAGKIPSSGNTIVGLPEVFTLVEKISNFSPIVKIPTGKVDTLIIDAVAKTQLQKDFAAYTINQESYESWFPVRKIAKEIADILDIQEINSLGDLQQRFPNLYNSKNALKLFPNQQHIVQAINNIQLPEIQKYISHLQRFQKYAPIIESDLKTVEDIKNLLENFTEKNRLETAKIIHDKIKSLLRFDNGSGASIIGKTIAISLFQTKLDTHYTKFTSWILRTWRSVDELIENKDLQKRAANLMLTISHRWERTILRASAENYTLRVLEAMNQNIASPILEKNWKGQVSYTTSTLQDHFNLYWKKLHQDKNFDEISQILSSEIDLLKEENFSAQSIYNYFSNTQIQDFLASKWKDTHILPTVEEFTTPGVRASVFDYATPPTNRTPPKVSSFATKSIALLRTTVENFSPQAIFTYIAILSQILLTSIPKSVFTYIPKLFFELTVFTLPKNSLPKTLEFLGFKWLSRKIRKSRELQTFDRAITDICEKPNPVRVITWIINHVTVRPIKWHLKNRRYKNNLQEVKKIQAKKVYSDNFKLGKLSLLQNISEETIWKTAIKEWVSEFKNSPENTGELSDRQIAHIIEQKKVDEYLSSSNINTPKKHIAKKSLLWYIPSLFKAKNARNPVWGSQKNINPEGINTQSSPKPWSSKEAEMQKGISSTSKTVQNIIRKAMQSNEIA